MTKKRVTKQVTKEKGEKEDQGDEVKKLTNKKKENRVTKEKR